MKKNNIYIEWRKYKESVEKCIWKKWVDKKKI